MSIVLPNDGTDFWPGVARRILGFVLVAGGLGCPTEANQDETDGGDSTTNTDSSGHDDSGSEDATGTSGTDGGTESDSGSESDGESGSDSGSESDSGSGSDSGTGTDVMCPTFDIDDGSNSFECTMPFDCDRLPIWCSSSPLGGPFDDNGCMRLRCHEDSDCGNGEVCFISHLCDPDAGCFPSGINCRDETEKGSTYCACGYSDDCSFDTGWCIPEEDFPDNCDGGSDSAGSESGSEDSDAGSGSGDTSTTSM